MVWILLVELFGSSCKNINWVNFIARIKGSYFSFTGWVHPFSQVVFCSAVGGGSFSSVFAGRCCFSCSKFGMGNSDILNVVCGTRSYPFFFVSLNSVVRFSVMNPFVDTRVTKKDSNYLHTYRKSDRCTISPLWHGHNSGVNEFRVAPREETDDLLEQWRCLRNKDRYFSHSPKSGVD